MCKRHFGYIECPRCRILFGGIDIVERCAETPKPIYGWKEQPCNLVFYPHDGKRNRQTGFSTWHYKPQKPLGLVNKALAYSEETSVCENCAQAERNNALREELERKHEANWPMHVPQQNDMRIFEKSDLDQRLGSPRQIGSWEVCKRWCRCCMKRYWKRRADQVHTVRVAAKGFLGFRTRSPNGRF